jgi:LPXTG-motif cell wall-anchored protein
VKTSLRERRLLRQVTVAGLSAALGLSGLTALSLTTAQATDTASTAREISTGSLEWGLRTSYRNYIAGPIAHGEIVASDGAVWQDGPGNAKGPFSFPNATGTLDPSTGTGQLAFEGTVYSGGHDYGNGYILELSITNVRLHVDGDEGTVVVDAEYRPFVGANPNVDPPAVQHAEDLELGTVDLSGSDLAPDDDGVVTVSGAPVTGVPEAMEAIGWDQFYSTEMPTVRLDALSFTATLQATAEPEEPEEPTEPEEPEQPVWDPIVEVFVEDGQSPLGDTAVAVGDEIVVRGSGFDPAANVSTRPPVPAGLPAGVYVVFGKFADTWRPSEGAGSGARTVVDQRWAMTQATLDQVPANFQGAIRDQWVELTPDGDFEATLTVSTDDASGNYGVYTYAAGGAAANPDHELSVPVTVANEEEPGPDPEPADPIVSLSKTQNLDPYADVVTVSGVNFDPTALSDGLLVGIGSPTDDGSVPELEPANTVTPDGGRFEVDLFTQDVAPGTVLAVYTAPVDASAGDVYVTSTEIAFAAERSPHLEVTPRENVEVGQEIEVTGTGFAPSRKISMAITANTATHETYGWPTGWLAHAVVQADADGNLARTLTIADTVTGSGENCIDVQCYVASFSSAQASDATPVDYRADRSQDVFAEIGFTAGGPGPDPEPKDPSLTITPETVKRGNDVTFLGAGLTASEPASVVVSADPGAASDGILDWGVRESFRNYIEGNIAHGSVDVREPASRNDDGTFRFASGQGVVSDDALELTFAGQVHFEGHDYGDGPLLRMTISNPTVVADGDTGLLIADISSKSLSSGEVVDYPQVEFAELDFGQAALTVSNGVVSATDVPATLTEDGVPAFADFYDAGQSLDPVSFEATLGGDVQVELGPATVDDNGSVELAWTVPADFPLGTATATLTAGDVELTGEFTVEAANNPDNGGDETGDDDGSDENGSDGGTDDGSDENGAGDAGSDTGGDDGTDDGAGAAGNETDAGGSENGKDGPLPNTGAGSHLLLWAVVAMALGGTGVVLLTRRRLPA